MAVSTSAPRKCACLAETGKPELKSPARTALASSQAEYVATAKPARAKSRPESPHLKDPALGLSTWGTDGSSRGGGEGELVEGWGERAPSLSLFTSYSHRRLAGWAQPSKTRSISTF